MSLDQFQMYLKAVQRIEKSQMRNDVIASTAGARYDEKSLDKLYKQLEDK